MSAGAGAATEEKVLRVRGHGVQRHLRRDGPIRQRSLVDDQSGGNRDAVSDEVADRFLGFGALDVHRGERPAGLSSLRALVRVLPGRVFGIGPPAVLQVVDTDLGGFAEADRAKMAGHLEAAFVGLLDRRPQLIARDVVVSLERRETQVRPVVDHLARFFRTVQLMQLQNRTALPFQVGRGQMDFRSDHLACIDAVLDVLVQVGLHAATGTHRRHAVCQVELRESHAQRRVQRGVAAGGIEQVLVHADDAGDHGVAFEFQNLGVVRNSGACGIPDRPNASLGDDDRLILDGGRARPVDHADVRQSDNRGVNADELPDGGRQFRCLRHRYSGADQKEYRDGTGGFS